jgi:U32 family peptidase
MSSPIAADSADLMTSPTLPVDRPELLAPAGDRDALAAAIANGADAVYFGLSDFNARYRATNFTLEELPEIMAELHTHGVRGYVAFNTLIFSDELPRAVEYLTQVISSGVDAVIVQDLGIVALLHRLAPELAVHGSTQMTLTEPRGIEFVRRMGVERVILARELTVAEIARIRAESTTPVEVFVHGALCVAYSGQCLTSESFGGRSANRGQCAQACRQPYELIVDGEPRALGDKAYLLSPQDLAAYDLVGDLARIGVASLKIEGRLKSAQYVAATTQTYRAAIDAAGRGEAFTIDPTDKLALQQSFSRGFSPGFLAGVNHQELVQGRFPKHRGVRLGVVSRIEQDRVVVSIERDLIELAGTTGWESVLKPGDGVVFDEGHPEQDEQGGRVFACSLTTQAITASSQRLTEMTLAFGRGALNLAAIAEGAIVWKTDDPALRKRLERTYDAGQLVRHGVLVATLVGVPGQPLALTLTDGGTDVTVRSAQPLEAARKYPLTEALAREQLGRLGGTPFELGEIRLRTGEGVAVESLPVMAPKSVLNELRRDAVAALVAKRTQAGRGRAIHTQALEELRVVAAARRHRGSASGAAQPELIVLVRTLDQFRAAANWSRDNDDALALVYCDFEDVRSFREAVAGGRRLGLPVGLATPRIIKPSETGLLLQIAKCAPDAVLVRNLAGLEFFRQQSSGLRLRGDYSLNVANELTAELLLAAGCESLTPSYDLNLDQLTAMLGRTDAAACEVVLHQHMPMFHMEHCVFSHLLSNGTDWHSCGRPCDRHRVELKDHVGEPHPLVADVGCRNTVFNARPQSAGRFLPALRAAGVRQFRVELLRETAGEVAPLLRAYADLLAGKAAEAGLVPASSTSLPVLNQLGVVGTLAWK